MARSLWGAPFTSFNGTTGIRPDQRLNTDGSLDPALTPAPSLDSVPWEILIQPDDKVLLVGGFVTVNGTIRNRVARLNADGSLDTSYNPVTGADNPVNDIKIQPGGKVVIVGTFSTFNGDPADASPGKLRDHSADHHPSQHPQTARLGNLYRGCTPFPPAVSLRRSFMSSAAVSLRNSG